MNNRRNFLKIAGVGLTGSLINPVTSSASKLSVGKQSLKIGVLLPQSNQHPLYPASFLNGLRLAVNTGQQFEDFKTEVITEQINYGSPLITSEKVKQLITENNVNLLVGLFNSEVAHYIGDFVSNVKIPVIIANSGENYLTRNLKENPYLFFNTLNLCRNSYLAGKYAAENYGKRIAVVTSLYDSGYNALSAFYHGVEAAGGKITETYLRNSSDNDFISKTLDSIEKENLDGIYVFLNGNLAEDFFRTTLQRNLSVPIITTSFVADDNRLVNLGNAANGVHHFSNWSKNLNNKENETFFAEYKKRYAKKPDQFGFLGYESGLIVNYAISKCQGDFSGYNLVNAISRCKIVSPGGQISVNKKTGLVNNPAYLCKAKVSEFSIPENVILEQYSQISDFEEHISLNTNLRSGFINPYLFV